MKHKSKIRLLIVALVVLLMSSIFTGCAMLGAGSAILEKNGKLYIASDLAPNTSESDREMNFVGYSRAPTNALKSYGLTAEKLGSPIRNLAVLMYNSVFCGDGTGYLGSDGYDYITTTTSGFPLDPAIVTTKTVEATEKAFTYNDNGIESVGNSTNGSPLDLTTVMTTIKAVANAILIAVWSMGFISQIVNERFTMDTLLKTLMQLLMGVVLVNSGDSIVVAFMKIGNEAIAGLSNSGNNLADIFTAFAQEIRNELNAIPTLFLGINILSLEVKIGLIVIDIIGPIWAMLLMILPFVGQLICSYKILSMLVMRFLELVIRITFAPIPIAFGAQSGFSQDAIRYFRGILACAMQPALIIIGVACVGSIVDIVCNVFDTGTGASGLTGVIAAIAIFLAYTILSAFINETKRLAQEIIAR